MWMVVTPTALQVNNNQSTFEKCHGIHDPEMLCIIVVILLTALRRVPYELLMKNRVNVRVLL